MELIEGRTLRALPGLALGELCRIGNQAAKALAAAHAAGIVHRDIKPENIMVRGDGYVKVLDFGLARVAPVGMGEKETASAQVTAAGTILGTVRYMSPEQARGESAAAPSDIFSFGIVLYELATGRHPFAAASQLEVLHAILSDAPVPPARLRPEIPAALEGLILQMLQKDPRLRPTAAAVGAVLAECPVSAVAAPATVPPRHTVGREKEIAQLHSAYDSALTGRGLAREIAVEFLTLEEFRKYLALEFPEHRFPPDLPDLLYRRTEGNALFMADLVRYLKDRRVITMQEGRWVLGRSLPGIERELPESVRSMIEKNINRLTDGDRRILAAASVQGQEFDSAVVAAALGVGQADIHLTLTRPEETIADLELAEEAAREGGDLQTQIVAMAMQASALVMSKEQKQGERHAARAVEMARQAGDDVSVAVAEAALAGILTVVGDLAEADRCYDRAIPVLQRKGPMRSTFNACGVRCLMYEWQLEHAKLEALLEWMRPKADEIGGSYHLLLYRYTGALGHGNQGRLSHALSDLREVHRLAELNGDRFFIPRVPNVLAWLYRELLDMETALKWDADGARIAHEMGCDEAEANSHVNLGHDYLALGEPARAYDHLEEAAKIFQRDEWYRWRYNIRLRAERASYWTGRGDLKQAAAHATASLESAKATLSRKHWAWAHKLLGDIALLEDRAPDARCEYEQALPILERHSCPIIEWKILLAAADAARLLHDTSSADSFRARARHVVQSLAESITERSVRERFLASKPLRDI